MTIMCYSTKCGVIYSHACSLFSLLMHDHYRFAFHVNDSFSFNPFSANPKKWSNTLKQFVGNLPTNCLSVLDYFVGLVLKGLRKSTNSNSLADPSSKVKKENAMCHFLCFPRGIGRSVGKIFWKKKIF